MRECPRARCRGYTEGLWENSSFSREKGPSGRGKKTGKTRRKEPDEKLDKSKEKLKQKKKKKKTPPQKKKPLGGKETQ